MISAIRSQIKTIAYMVMLMTIDQGEAYNHQQKKADYLDLGGENFSTD